MRRFLFDILWELWGDIPLKLTLPSGGWALCSTGFPHQVRVLRSHLYQGMSLWEAVFGFSVFLLTTQHICSFYDGWLMSAPAHTTLSVQQFLIPNVMTPCAPPSIFTQSHPKWLVFLSPDEKSPQRETFGWCGRGETKNSRSTKASKSTSSELFWAVDVMVC